MITMQRTRNVALLLLLLIAGALTVNALNEARRHAPPPRSSGGGEDSSEQNKARYNVHTDVIGDNGTNMTNYPKNDCGNNFFLRIFCEWQRGNRMVEGQNINKAVISQEEVAKRASEFLLKHGVDPLKASEAEMKWAVDSVLEEWSNSILH